MQLGKPGRSAALGVLRGCELLSMQTSHVTSIAGEPPDWICPTCQESLPRDSEFFFRNKTCSDGLSNTCKACISETRHRQMTAAADDPRIEVLRCAVKAGDLPSARLVDIREFLRRHSIPAPDARVLARMLDLLSQEALLKRVPRGKRVGYRLVPGSPTPPKAEQYSAAITAARASARQPGRMRGDQRLKERRLTVEWYLMYRRFRRKVRESGTTELPLNDVADRQLCTWIRTQRGAYRKGTLQVRRERLLDRLGMVWNVYDAQWEAMFARLKAFHRTYGHVRIWKDSPDHPELGRWVHRQRQMKTKNHRRLTPERIKRLEALGMDWRPTPGKPHGSAGWIKRRM